MPGVIMDNTNVVGAGQGIEARNGLSPSPVGTDQYVLSIDPKKGSMHVNGATQVMEDGEKQAKTTLRLNKGPPELPHVTQGFFPFSKLVNRSVQQCWNDLSDLLAELADVQMPSHDASSSSLPTNGKLFVNQSSENIQKKLRILDFVHAKRAEFIKLLVLSQWSRQAAGVSKLIDLQNFIRTRHQAYVGALQWTGDMKRDLVQAQVANPDLKTALEVLSKAKIVSMPDLGYKPLRPLTAKCTLKKLKKIDKIIATRLTLCDVIPRPFQTYRVHDGRVTFIVSGEFELDLSIGKEDESSQFYFVDIRFLFHPSSSVPQGRLFNELDIKVNDVLRHSGLIGCFDMLHNLVLINKISILFKQAMELAKGLWSDVLHIELLHRTLVVHYWALKPGSKSWVEIGIKSGRPKYQSHSHKVPYLGLRWMRDGQEVESGDIEFDTENLSMENILRSVLALHISHILYSAHKILSKSFVFASGLLSLRSQLSGTEPGDCQLDVQLTTSKYLRVSIEPMSGSHILSASPSTLVRMDIERSHDRQYADDIVSRVSRLRCIAAIEEIESHVKMLGFESVNPRGLKIDMRKVFPANVVRFSFFWHHFWERTWAVAVTSSMDGDNWWVVQLLPPTSANSHSAFDTSAQNHFSPRSAQIISSTLSPVQQPINCTSSADIEHCLSGILAVYANARYLADVQSIDFYPVLHRLMIGSNLQVPDIFIRYDMPNIPQALQLASPSRLKKGGLIKETIRVSFHGVDPRKKAAIMVAYGSLLVPAKVFNILRTTWDHSVVFSRRGNGFAIRLLAPAGRPVMASLLEKLQRLECVLSVLEVLQRKKMSPQSLSLSHVAFKYGPEKDLSASIDIGLSSPLFHEDAKSVNGVSQTDPLFCLRLGINFGCSNPHRRIQRSLTTILNRSSTDAGLDAVTELLSLTLPLLQAVDEIMNNPSHKGPLKVQVIARNAKAFIIHYPIQELRFQLVASQHLGHMVWTLRDKSSSHDLSNKELRSSDSWKRLYSSRGDGWRGLGNGVIAEVDKIGNLISELDRYFSSSSRDHLGPKNSGADTTSIGLSNSAESQTVQLGGAEGTESMSQAGLTPTTRMSGEHMQSMAGPIPQNTDIIMID